MSDNNKKRSLYIGVENELSPNELDFFSSRFSVKQILFSDLLKKRQSLNFIYFSGGADVSPILYGEGNKGSRTMISAERDSLCKEIFEIYVTTPKLGICRGSQFVTAMSGGKLIQHVEGHGNTHDITMHFEGNSQPSIYKITSTHHQMMFPFNLPKHKYNILAWSTKHRSLVYLDGNDTQIELPEKFVESEIVYYPMTRSLAIQGHPEFDSCDKRTKEMCLNLIEDYLI